MKRPNLIIDVGMHDGRDTAFYLAKGFDVVAIEANPQLVEDARRRFAAEIDAGRLQLLGVAIAETEGTLPLAVSDETSIWSSLSPDFVERNERLAGTSYRTIEVPTRPFGEILAEVGVPRYLKVDIEGMDMLCVRALRDFSERPDFVSVESAVTVNDAAFAAIFDELAELWTLGYRRFAYVNQALHPGRRPPRPAREGTYADVALTADGSGLFGEELPVPWESIDRALVRSQALRLQHNAGGFGGRWTDKPAGLAYRAGRRLLRRRPGWYDLHAALDPQAAAAAVAAPRAA